MLFGATIGSIIKNIPLAIILAFLSHYFLDLFPHIEYNIENIEKKQWHKSLPNILKISIDFFIGISIIFILSGSNPIIYICVFFAILPDGFTILNAIMPNKILGAHNRLHQKIHFLKIHPVKYGGAVISAPLKLFNWEIKISNFWRIFTQLIVVVISITLLIFLNHPLSPLF
jgi:hypothetical protein